MPARGPILDYDFLVEWYLDQGILGAVEVKSEKMRCHSHSFANHKLRWISPVRLHFSVKSTVHNAILDAALESMVTFLVS